MKFRVCTVCDCDFPSEQNAQVCTRLKHVHARMTGDASSIYFPVNILSSLLCELDDDLYCLLCLVIDDAHDTGFEQLTDALVEIVRIACM